MCDRQYMDSNSWSAVLRIQQIYRDEVALRLTAERWYPEKVCPPRYIHILYNIRMFFFNCHMLEPEKINFRDFSELRQFY